VLIWEYMRTDLFLKNYFLDWRLFCSRLQVSSWFMMGSAGSSKAEH